jgi:uncharacterized membrane protein YsdA (DUF1294 family)
VYLGASALTFFGYWLDKVAAQRTLHRTSEQTLQLFRHKTRKASFQVVFWACVVMNCCALGWVVWQGILSN